jgi:hypothetical protein
MYLSLKPECFPFYGSAIMAGAALAIDVGENRCAKIGESVSSRLAFDWTPVAAFSVRLRSPG